MGRRVALLGCANDTLVHAPFNEDWEIWASGQHQPDVKRWDVWWEIHNIDQLGKNFDFHRKWLSEQTKPVVVSREHPLVPSGVVLDFKPFVDEFGKEFFTSTVSWMLVKAITEKYDEIGLYGVEMATDGEYAYQRAGLKHFQWVAEQRGIKVTIPSNSRLNLEKEPYPFCDESPLAIRINEDLTKIGKDLDLLNENKRAFELRAAAHDGARQALEEIRKLTGWNGWKL